MTCAVPRILGPVLQINSVVKKLRKCWGYYPTIIIDAEGVWTDGIALGHALSVSSESAPDSARCQPAAGDFVGLDCFPIFWIRQECLETSIKGRMYTCGPCDKGCTAAGNVPTPFGRSPKLYT